MQEISNSLRQRLGAKPGPQEHPDADLLTAYSEHALPAAERTAIILHLAQCNYCREVLSLILPQAQPEPQVASVFGSSRFWIPAFRWGAAVATLAIAVTLLVEKPWKTVVTGPIQRTQMTQPSPTVQPLVAATTASEPPATQNIQNPAASPTTAILEARSSTGSGLGSAVNSERRGAQRTAPSPPQAAVVGAIQTSAIQPSLHMSANVAAIPGPAPTQLSRSTATQEPYQQPGQNYLNTNVLKATDAATVSMLPSAPAPQGANGQATSHAKFPAVTLQDVPSRAMVFYVVPPKTAPASGSAPGDTNLSKSNGFGSRFTSTISAAINKIKNRGSPSQAWAGPNLRRAVTTDNTDHIADSEDGDRAQGPPQFRISPDGILMQYTDATRWHEVYPQGSDLLFKSLIVKGDQVWAGGSDATLIHSWNAGVDWETLKVPDSGDITSITVDDGWQVKTSNGQAFVSQDNGKTWVPLKAEPK